MTINIPLSARKHTFCILEAWRSMINCHCAILMQSVVKGEGRRRMSLFVSLDFVSCACGQWE